MSVRGLLAVVGVEGSKLRAQAKARVLLAACVASPFVFVAAMRVQSSLPEDTLFGRAVKESGFATPLVVLGFASLWVFPMLTSVVGGDVFSAEDRYGTWTTVLTRSRSRAEVFAGKVLTALAFSSLAVTALAVSSMAAGVLVFGSRPLVDLSGALLSPAQAVVRVALAWASMLPPAFAFTAVAVLLSVATRSSAVPEIGGDAVLYCDPADAGSIAQGMTRLAGDHVDLAEAGRDRSKDGPGAGREAVGRRREPLADLLTREVDVDVVAEDGRHLREAVPRERAPSRRRRRA